MPYGNANDQSPGFENEDNLTIVFEVGTPRVAAVRDEEGNVTEDAIPGTGGTCRCGCGEDVAAGSLYRPGHDARLKGKIQRAAIAGVKVTVNGKTMSPEKAAELEKFAPKGTIEAINLGLEKARSNARSKEEREAEREAKKAERASEREARKAELQAEKDAKAAAQEEAVA